MGGWKESVGGEDESGGWEDEQDEGFSGTRMEWDGTKWDEDERMA